jgi:hypothetical protein
MKPLSILEKSGIRQIVIQQAVAVNRIGKSSAHHGGYNFDAIRMQNK